MHNTSFSIKADTDTNFFSFPECAMEFFRRKDYVSEVFEVHTLIVNNYEISANMSTVAEMLAKNTYPFEIQGTLKIPEKNITIVGSKIPLCTQDTKVYCGREHSYVINLGSGPNYIFHGHSCRNSTECWYNTPAELRYVFESSEAIVNPFWDNNNNNVLENNTGCMPKYTYRTVHCFTHRFEECSLSGFIYSYPLTTSVGFQNLDQSINSRQHLLHILHEKKIISFIEQKLLASQRLEFLRATTQPTIMKAHLEVFRIL